MRKRWYTTALMGLLAIVATAASADKAAGQGMQQFAGDQAFFTGTPQPGPGQVRSAHLMDAHGQSAVVPAQYAASSYDAFGGASMNVEQCGPHYFDVSLEYLMLDRGEVFRNFQPFSFAGVNGPVVLSGDSLSTDIGSGFRIEGRYDIGALSVLEVGYSSVFDIEARADVNTLNPNPTFPDRLGALMSPFTSGGTNPNPGFNPGNLEDFEETDRAVYHALEYDSDYQTTEINYRRYWVGYSPRVTGTLLWGVRYSKLKEGFLFFSTGQDFDAGSASPAVDPNVPPRVGTAEYRIDTDNDLIGLQVGGDTWMTMRQGLRIGAEGKVGLFNNHYDIERSFATSDNGAEEFSERFAHNQVAFIAEGSLGIVADIWSSVSVKLGYEVHFLNSIAAVGDNFDPGSPYTSPGVPARVGKFYDQGNALYHGFHGGLEYVW